MATNWSMPALSQAWADFLAAIKGRDESLAKLDFTGDSNIPDGAIRWNAAANRFEIWSASSSTWGALAASYAIDVDTVDGKHASAFAPVGHVGATGDAHGVATTGAAGFMSAADKTLLNGATNAATANALARRDAAGRLQAAAPSAAADVARKAETDAAMDAAAAAHGAASAAQSAVSALDMAVSTPNGSGRLPIATQAQMEAGASAAVVATALGVRQARDAAWAGRSLAKKGYQRLPSGLILQWGEDTAPGNGSSAALNFPITFPTAVLVTFGSGINPGPSAGDGNSAGAFSISASQYRVFFDDGPGSQVVHWIAIGH